MILISFIVFLLLFVAIGALSALQSQKTSKDYLLAGQSVKPWLTALSAVATNNSGYMFIGQIGFTYMYGLHSAWLMIGWIFGDFISSLVVHKRLRMKTEENKVKSFASAISSWSGADFKYLRIIGGIVTILFLGTYAAAQFNAGGKALHVLFGWDYTTGAVIGSIIVLVYCLAGGIRASIWTDAAQSFVMFGAMTLMMFTAVQEVGGFSAFIEALQGVAPDYMNVLPPENGMGPFFGPSLFILGWFMAGVGVIGQPHIMVRFMAMENPEDLTRTRIYYYGWYTTFAALTIGSALAARLLIPEVADFDAELALPSLAHILLPEVLVGLVLAGLFAATMSTADSQVLSCTAAITNDVAPKTFNSYRSNKIATVLVTAVALGIVFMGNDSVFSLVLIAWSALAAAFGPLLIVYALGQAPSEKLALSMLFGGMAGMLAWRLSGLNSVMYEVAPGVVAGLAIFVIAKVWSNLTASPTETKSNAAAN